MKKQMFLNPVTRLFTRSETGAYDALAFTPSCFYGDEGAPTLSAPEGWSAEAVSLLADHAAYHSVPSDLLAVEENTVPSWLWRHRIKGGAKGTRRQSEGDVRQIFDRVAGSAAAKGWKLGLFAQEKQARAFYDEMRALLAQRVLAIDPKLMREWGLEWAYGVTSPTKIISESKHDKKTLLTNADLDRYSRDGKKGPAWKKLFATSKNQTNQIAIRLADTAEDWHSSADIPARAAIDVLALRHNDGSINLDALQHTVRLAFLLLDLQDAQDVTLGLVNLAPLLMALGLPYDSEAARAMAASIAALVSAEGYSASAEMAALRGASEAFTAEREKIMRSLRNHSRAAQGDGSDYEKIAILPMPLSLRNCPDLALAARVQQRWQQAVEAARASGLRACQITDLTSNPTLGLFMESVTQGLEPMPSLTCLLPGADDVYRTALHPVVGEALTRLHYPHATATVIIRHIIGEKSLRASPSITPRLLRMQGFDDAAIARVETYLPSVSSLRLAMTKWVVGIDFCRTHLKIPARSLESPRFDLLTYLGYSAEDIAAADTALYGYGTVRNAKALNLRHRSVFACGGDITAEARLRMAAAVQSFISGDCGMTLRIAASQAAERGTSLVLAAWRQGLKSLTLTLDPALTPQMKAPKKLAARRIKPALHAHAKPIDSVKRASQSRTKSVSARSARKAREQRSRLH